VKTQTDVYQEILGKIPGEKDKMSGHTHLADSEKKIILEQLHHGNTFGR